jgi:hypothetical protein
VARVDAPLLDHISITFFTEITFAIPQLLRFISRIPKWQTPDKAHMVFDYGDVWIKFSSPTQVSGDEDVLRLGFLSPYAYRQILCVVQFCRSPFSPLPTLKDLHISGHRVDLCMPRPERGISENVRWLELLRQFTTVKNLYLSEVFVPRVGAALQELVGERTREVLPALQVLYLEELGGPSGPTHEAITQFLTARRLFHHPIRLS